MYPDSPERLDVPPQERPRGASPARASLLGGLLGGIGVLVVLILTNVVAIPGLRSRVDDTNVDSAAVATSDTAVADSVSVPAIAVGDTVVAMETDTVAYVPAPLPAPVPMPAPEPAEPPPPTAAQRELMYRDALKEAILEADNAEMEARRRLDPAPLYTRYTGEILQTHLSGLESLREEGIHADSRLLNVRWHSFWVSPDERTARVETTETWYTEYHRNGSDACVAVVPEHDVPQRVTLRRVSGVWKVASVSFTGASHEPQACP